MVLVMKQHFSMMRKQKPLAFISLLTGMLFLIFSVFHAAILAGISMPTHHGEPSTSQHTIATSCIQQCTVVNSENRLKSEQDEQADPLKPFEQLLAAVSMASGILYLAPHTILLVKRKLKIPIYLQVASIRI